ncbi:DUF4043 family protein [Achromobacter mucicolens]|uniref:phage capsid family protein n=1 Tax=Achromobacter mucicolens TaxID=1389922 RepID=UPI0020A5F2FD|nr:DUF4043 family protein [Achromobacter mucicolens]MCP2517410.1 DUF4043 family protein [Achromobacter mucicolens]
MSQTTVPVGSPLARKVFGAALFANTQRQPSLMNNLTGAAPKQAAAEAKLKGQTSPDMPLVRVTDLTKSQGDQVSVDLINQTGGKPIMGDKQAEGKGERLDMSSMDIRIDLATKVVDAGGKMTQQRTVHNLRALAMANLQGWFRRFNDQSTIVHLAGTRGSQVGTDWVVPMSNDPDFGEIMINPVKAPTFNRHWVADGQSLVQGGQALNALDTTDTFKLEHLDHLGAIIDDMEFKLQPIKIAGDAAADDEPLYLLLVTNRMWQSILTNTAANSLQWRTFLQNAWNRASSFSGPKKHPLFTGEAGIWHNILVRKMDRAIRLNPGDAVQYCTQAGQATAAEATATVPDLQPGHAVDRGMLLGAQALAHVYGKNQGSDTYANWMENRYNFERNLEVAGEVMCGKAKLRFSVPDARGNKIPTDHGVMVLDTVVNLNT